MAPKDPEKRLRELKSQKGTALNAAPAPNGLAGGALALRRAQRPFDTLYTTTPAPEIPGKFPKISVFGAGRGRNSTPALTSPLLTSCARLHSHRTRFGTYFKVYSTLTDPFLHFKDLELRRDQQQQQASSKQDQSHVRHKRATEQCATAAAAPPLP